MPAPASTEGSTEGVEPASGKRLAEPPPHPTSALRQLKTKGKQNPRSELENAIRMETVGTAAADMFQADISTCSPYLGPPVPSRAPSGAPSSLPPPHLQLPTSL